ncbi:NAD-dependent deacetylase [Candidatus Lokiarchaeum ossiferum]|uniref:NAD-dependent deacetylase n=1 Tax=Candidatus Lokiarchaeum ossiferum TaxID=2951803 RepID=UPI00352DC0D5
MSPTKQDLSYEERIQLAVKWIQNSQHLVVFTGAGISTESGIPDYRGPDGVWTRRDKGLPPLKMKMTMDQVQPNSGHEAIVELQNRGLLKFLISQNVDGLHLRSGISSEIIAELHGNRHLMRCLTCDLQHPKDYLWDSTKWGNGYRTSPIRDNQPGCPACGGRLMSSVVNFGDPMPQKEMDLAQHHSMAADVLIVIGSSLAVMPAASFPLIAKENGSKLIIINHQETMYDSEADLCFHESAGATLQAILSAINE